MRMIDKIMRSMRDTGLLDGMSDEDCDTIATAALEGTMEPTSWMLNEAVQIYEDQNGNVSGSEYWHAMVNAAINE